jgi:hypothetical protein
VPIPGHVNNKERLNTNLKIKESNVNGKTIIQIDKLSEHIITDNEEA